MTEILRTQFALDDSQYFSTVEVLPGDPDRDRAHRARQHPRRRRTAATAIPSARATARTPTCAARLQWEDRRINTSGHRFNVELKAAPKPDRASSRTTSSRSAIRRSRSSRSRPRTRSSSSPTSTPRISSSSRASRRCAGRWQWVYFVTATNTDHRDRRCRTRTDNLLIPGISVASVPQGYLGEALFSRGLFAELRGSHHVFGSDSDFLQLDVQSERVFDLSRKLAPAAARRSRREPGREVQRAARHGALLRRRRPQRARLRLQRAVARHGRHGRERQSGSQDDERQRHHREGGRQAPAHRHGRAGARPAAQLRRRDVLRLRQRVRQLRRSARVLGGRRLPLPAAGRHARHRHRAAAVRSTGASPRLHINFSPKL